MAGELAHGLFENKTVDEADQPQLFDGRNKLAPGDNPSILIAHPQQAFEIIDLSGRRTHHRLESKEQPILAQRGLNRRPHR